MILKNERGYEGELEDNLIGCYKEILKYSWLNMIGFVFF